MSFLRNLLKTKKQIEEERIIELNLVKEEKIRQAKAIQNDLEVGSTTRLLNKKDTIPLIKADLLLTSTLNSFKSKRERLNNNWDVAYKNFSWWNKLKHDEKLDLSDLDKRISDLEIAVNKFNQKHKADVCNIDEYFEKLIEQSNQRLGVACQKLQYSIRQGDIETVDKSLIAATWLSIISVPASVVADVVSSNAIYDALRSVNSNFEEMSNSEIWWETLWMSSESLRGLTSLTKGAYFENLVANDTGGQLADHFNNPDTDITIEGIEVQLKATNSIGYINSVDDDIPVVATTEVAEYTNALDSGYTNDELTSTVDMALGGFIDAKGTAVDAILTGVGSLGIFASIRGINHAAEKYEKGVNAEEAFFKGMGIAIEGTAKGIVDASEMVYKVAMSRPSRFVGETLYRGLEKLDEKLFGESESTIKK